MARGGWQDGLEGQGGHSSASHDNVIQGVGKPLSHRELEPEKVNSVLSYIAGLLVLLLFGALIGPSVVDWNEYRSGIEAQISQATGRYVTIEGDIDFVILPSPRFRLTQIAVRPSAEAEPFARADVLEGEVALTPLLRGEIDVASILARDFVVDLVRDADGHMNWASEVGDAAIEALDPSDVRLDLVRFENGSLRIDDKPSGRAFAFSTIDGELKAGSLIGPYRFDGSFVLGEEDLSVALGVGVIAGDRAFPVSIDLRSERFNWKAGFTGIGTEASLAGRLDGVLQMQIGNEKAVDDVVQPAFLTAKSGLVVSRRQAVLRDVEVHLAGAPLKGQVNFNYEDAPRVTGRLSGALLPLDVALDSFSQLDFPRTRTVLPVGLSAAFDLAVAEVTYAGARVRDVTMDVEAANGELSIDALRGQLMGVAEASVAGVLKMENRSPRFDGTIFGEISTLSGFEKWLAKRSNGGADDVEPYTPSATGKLDFTTSISLKRTLAQAYGLSLAFVSDGEDHLPLTGGFSWATQKGLSATSLELKGGYADLSFLAGLETWLEGHEVSDFASLNGRLVFDVDRLKYGNLNYANVDVAVGAKDGVLQIERASADQALPVPPGDEVEEAAPVQAVSLQGAVTSLSPKFAGEISGTLNAPLAARLADAYLPPLLPQLDRGVDSGNVTFDLRGASDEGSESHDVHLAVQGDVDGADVNLRASERHEAGEASRTELSLTIRDQASGFLPSLLNLPGGAMLEEGELLFTLVGDRAGVMEMAALYRVAGSALSLKGDLDNASSDAHFEGRFEAKADAYARLAQQFALSGALSDLIAENGKGGAVLATGHLDWRGQEGAVRDVEAVAGSFRVSGEGQADWRGDIPVLNAELELGRVSFDHLFDADEGSGWSAHPLDWSALGAASGSFEIAASGLSVAGLEFKDVATVASLEDGVLSLSPLTGQFGDGRVTMGLRVEGGKGVPGLGLTIAVEEAELDAATKMVFGAPLAAGTVTGNVQIEGRGRSQLGLVSTLSGRGRLALRSGSFGGFDLVAFRNGVEGLQDVSQFAPLIELTLLKGANGFDLLEGELHVEDGVLKFVAESGDVAGASSTKVTSYADLVRRELDLETRFSLVGDNPLPPITMVLSGPFRDLSRKLDTINLQSAVAQRMLIGELKASGVENVPDELLDLIVSPEREDELDVPIDDVLPMNDEADASEDTAESVSDASSATDEKKDEIVAAPEREPEAVAEEVEAANDNVPLPRLKPQRGARR